MNDVMKGFHDEVQRQREKRRRLDYFATAWIVCVAIFCLTWVVTLVWVGLHFAIKYW